MLTSTLVSDIRLLSAAAAAVVVILSKFEKRPNHSHAEDRLEEQKDRQTVLLFLKSEDLKTGENPDTRQKDSAHDRLTDLQSCIISLVSGS